jgi:hypothetical protein
VAAPAAELRTAVAAEAEVELRTAAAVGAEAVRIAAGTAEIAWLH